MADLVSVSTGGVIGVVVVAELLLSSGSTTRLGTSTVAVFVIDPVDVGATTAVTVYTTDDPFGMVTESLIAPLPAAVQAAPAGAAQVQAVNVTPAGTGSVNSAPAMLSGPAFETVIV